MDLNKNKEVGSVESMFTQEDIENMEKDKQEVENLFDRLSKKWRKYCMSLFADIQYVLMSTEILQDQWGKQAPMLTRILRIIEWWGSKDKHMMASKLSTKYKIKEVFKYVEDEKDPDNVPDRISDNKDAKIPIHRPKKKKRHTIKK